MTKGLGEVASDPCVHCRGKTRKGGNLKRIGGKQHCNENRRYLYKRKSTRMITGKKKGGSG
jgi:hypothetical protein